MLTISSLQKTEPPFSSSALQSLTDFLTELHIIYRHPSCRRKASPQHDAATNLFRSEPEVLRVMWEEVIAHRWIPEV